MITINEVEKLASLSRLSLTDKEKNSFLAEIDAILGYVGNINSMAEDVTNLTFTQINNLREDMVIHRSGEFTESLLKNAPETENGFVKVKKILV